MKLEELQEKIDDIIIHENSVEHLIVSRDVKADFLQKMFDEVEEEALALAKELTPADLDALEASEEGYEEWLLRIAPLVEGKASQMRAKRFLNDEDEDVRKYAKEVMERTDFSKFYE